MTHRLSLLACLLAGVALHPSAARADQDLEVGAPYAEARAVYTPPTSSTSTEDWKVDGDYYPWDLFPKPKYAFGSAGKAWAQAAASVTFDGPTPRFGLVTARSQDDNGVAVGVAVMLFDVVDPKHRAKTLVDVELKSAAEVRSGTADVTFRLAKVNNDSGYVTLGDDGKIKRTILPENASWSPLAGIMNGWVHIVRGSEDDTGLVELRGSVNGRPGYEELHQAHADERTSASLMLEPGEYSMVLTAGVTGQAIAVNDPIVRPNSSNPDVVVTIKGAVDPMPRAALMDTTAEDLAAAGFDPAPFVDLGFLDPPASSDTTTTTLPETTTTSTLPETTTTTLPSTTTCPVDDAGAVTCLCESDLGTALCPGEALPAGIGRGFGQACRAVRKGMPTEPGRKRRRSLARAAASFARALRVAGRPRAAQSLSASCRASLTTRLDEAVSRIQRLEANL